MKTFLLNLFVAEALAVAQGLVSISGLHPGVKMALENFILSGQALEQALQSAQ